MVSDSSTCCLIVKILYWISVYRYFESHLDLAHQSLRQKRSLFKWRAIPFSRGENTNILRWAMWPLSLLLYTTKLTHTLITEAKPVLGPNVSYHTIWYHTLRIQNGLAPVALRKKKNPQLSKTNQSLNWLQGICIVEGITRQFSMESVHLTIIIVKY